jgi:hypothetical protein
MRVLLAGGPMSGRIIDIEPEKSRGVIVEDKKGEVFRYERRTVYTHAGQEWVLYVCGDFEYDQLMRIIAESDLSDTGKIRILGPEYVTIEGSGK